MCHGLVVEELAVSAVGEKTLEIMIYFYILNWILIWVNSDKGLPLSHRILFGQVFVDCERQIRGIISRNHTNVRVTHVAIFLRRGRTGAFDLLLLNTTFILLDRLKKLAQMLSVEFLHL